jgi:hypothetical protein
MSNVYELQEPFIGLFGGLDDFRTAFGTGRGQWVKRPLRPTDVVEHLQGQGAGIGLPPLRSDNTCVFAAIDLDEPDFEAAMKMQKFLPGTTWLERSRSGNAHVWVFFESPVEAWVPMGILREACIAVGKPRVEVFPKNHDFAKVKLGNYINLPYHGSDRPVLVEHGKELPLNEFVRFATESRNSPADWRKRARYLLIEPPELREKSQEFGKARDLHMCAEHIIAHADDNPIMEGHRAVVYFSLAKMLTNWSMIDHDEALDLMRSVNEESPDRIPDSELRRILGNAERGEYTSTGCDDPVMAPYVHPDCPIANPRR